MLAQIAQLFTTVYRRSDGSHRVSLVYNAASHRNPNPSSLLPRSLHPPLPQLPPRRRRGLTRPHLTSPLPHSLPCIACSFPGLLPPTKVEGARSRSRCTTLSAPPPPPLDVVMPPPAPAHYSARFSSSAALSLPAPSHCCCCCGSQGKGTGSVGKRVKDRYGEPDRGE
jgi:hypothetical protein